MGMTPDQKELLSAFNAHKVKYLLVGGYAVSLHAEPRATKDMDIFIRSDEENSQAVFHALAAFGAPLEAFKPQDFHDGSTFQMGIPPDRIDILQKLDGVDFDESWESRVEAMIEGTKVPVISAEKLIQNKVAVGRPQDLADVAAIQEAQRAIQVEEGGDGNG